MKTQSTAKQATTHEIALRITELAPRFLEGLAPTEIAAILEPATLRRFPARCPITKEGERADTLFLLLEGLARTFTTTPDGKKIILLWVPSGYASGGRAFLSKPLKYLVTTETVTDCLALAWSRNAILPLSRLYPRLLENALLGASDYLEHYLDLHVAAGYNTAAQRIARALANLAEGVGQKTFEGTVINVTNEELADQANVTIFTVSRQLNDWQRKGLLTKSRMRIVVPSPEELVRSVG
jgi:CRP-like cAMP-binding protein